MSVVCTPSREPCQRVSLSTSVLIVMLLSLPISAEIRGVRAIAEQMSGLRVGVVPHQVLPAEIARRLCEAIRYEIRTGPVPILAQESADSIQSQGKARVLPLTTLREALLDLPPPACA